MKLLLDFEDAELIGDVTSPCETLVLVNCYNQEEYLPACLKGIEDQITDFPFRVLINDDASTDASQEILREFQKKHPDKVALILQKTNQFSKQRPTLARLLAYLDYDFVALCEADDYWIDNNKIQKQRDFLVSNPDFSLIHTGIDISNEMGNSFYMESLLRRLTTAKLEDPLDLAAGNYIMTCTVMIRKKSLIPELLDGIYRIYPGDWILFSFAADNGKIKYFPEKTAMYRIQANSTWSSVDPEVRLFATMEVHWFLAARLQSDLKHAFRSSLIQMLWSMAENSQIEGAPKFDNPIQSCWNQAAYHKYHEYHLRKRYEPESLESASKSVE